MSAERDRLDPRGDAEPATRAAGVQTPDPPESDEGRTADRSSRQTTERAAGQGPDRPEPRLEDEQRQGHLRSQPVWREYLEALLVAGLFLGFTNTFVLKTFYIPSGSMENTLKIGDHLIVNRYIYGPPHAERTPLVPARPPQRGDVVVFRSPEDPDIDLVKRLIGLPGDQVEVRQKRLFVNGREVHDQSFAIHGDPRLGTRRNAYNYQLYRRDNFGPLTVPPNHYFFLGDNRDFSYDSRYWGAVPRHYIKGRAFLIYWSYGGETPDGQWPGLVAKLRQLGRTALGFLTKTRWERTFQLIR